MGNVVQSEVSMIKFLLLEQMPILNLLFHEIVSSIVNSCVVLPVKLYYFCTSQGKMLT